ncbi:hypothetical protein [Trebonia sp.]|uniref:hypothetical protein n=1 Tax=Trebonia sp. TaxID=2767075 RepID=UPI002619477F|nr:hypothetical protein [Trebonia sp.]
MTWTFIVLILLALVLWGFYVSWRAGRLDRMHNRVEAARTALDLAMVRRSSSAAELASSGLLDPAASLLLASAVLRAKESDQAQRDLAESDLTRALRATVGQPGFLAELEGKDGAAELLAEVDASAHQVFIARKFYNDVAARTIDARRRPLVRVFRLAGNAPAPEFFEMDDLLGDGAGVG